MKIIYTRSFVRAYKRLPEHIKILAERKERLFKLDPHHSNLHTHKLHGRMADQWSFSINQKYRIIFRFLEDDAVLFNDVGTHDIYD